jgi:hypothetical protein
MPVGATDHSVAPNGAFDARLRAERSPRRRGLLPGLLAAARPGLIPAGDDELLAAGSAQRITSCSLDARNIEVSVDEDHHEHQKTQLRAKCRSSVGYSSKLPIRNTQDLKPYCQHKTIQSPRTLSSLHSRYPESSGLSTKRILQGSYDVLVRITR